jgi:mannose-6-phosphate isomerase
MAELFGRKLPDGLIGESWELYDRPDGASEIANGEFKGRTVASLRGNAEIPLLTKIIDARDTLSVQVHPDDRAAVELHGEAKTEAWYIIDVDPGAKIYKGLANGVAEPDLRKALETKTVPDLLECFTPAPGDVIFLPPGTVHAIGGGIVLFEVQENSDTTYRLYDWDRLDLDGKLRDLQIGDAIRSTDFSRPGPRTVMPREVSNDGGYRRTMRLSCPQFALEEQEIPGLVTFETERRRRDTLHVLFILDGEGTVRPFARNAEEVFFSRGDSILLPAEHENYEIEPRRGRTVRLLTTWTP